MVISSVDTGTLALKKGYFAPESGWKKAWIKLWSLNCFKMKQSQFEGWKRWKTKIDIWYFKFEYLGWGGNSVMIIHVCNYNIKMNKEIEGAVTGVKEFYGASRRFLDVCEKPDVAGTPTFIQSSKRLLPPAPSDSPSWEASATSSNCSSSPLTTSFSADLVTLF